MSFNSSFYTDGGVYDTAEVVSNDSTSSTADTQAPSSMYQAGGIYDFLNEENAVVASVLANALAAAASAATATASATSASASLASLLASGATATPLMDGVAAVGAATKWSREDHVHPTDTSRQAALGFTPVQQGTGIGQQGNNVKIGWSGSALKATVDTTDIGNFAFLASPAFTGTPTAPTAAVDTNTTQLATTAFVLAQAGSATPLIDATSAVVGTSTRFARQDHVHPTDTTRAPLASPSFTGTGSTFANELGVGGAPIGAGRTFTVSSGGQTGVAIVGTGGASGNKVFGLVYDPGNIALTQPGVIIQSWNDSGSFAANGGVLFRDGAAAFGSLTYPGSAGSVSVNGTLSVGGLGSGSLPSPTSILVNTGGSASTTVPVSYQFFNVAGNNSYGVYQAVYWRNGDGSAGLNIGTRAGGTNTDIVRMYSSSGGSVTAFDVLAPATFSSSVLSSSATGGIGYKTGAGSSANQGSSSGKSTAVTLNYMCGKITMNNASLAGPGGAVGFTLNNSNIAADDTVLVNIVGGNTPNAYGAGVDNISAGSCRIVLNNGSGGALAEAVVLRFFVLKSVIS